MNTIKKIFGIIFICFLIICVNTIISHASTPVFSDLEVDYECYESVLTLKELGIVDGYEDGEYKPWNNVTRAEFSKIVVCMMDKTTEAYQTPASSGFDDVNKVGWCIPYVNYLTSNGIIKGYGDATFKPNNVITYCEAVTILLRMLGYNEENIGYSWPQNYITKADNLKLAGDMEFENTSPITRASMAIIAKNTLFCDVKDKTDTSFLESIGYEILENCFILATKNEDSSLQKDEIKTSSGVFETEKEEMLKNINKLGTLVVDNDKKAVFFTPDELYYINTSITKISDNNVFEYKCENGSKGSFKFSSDFKVYYDNIESTYSKVANNIEVGTAISFFGESHNDWSFAVITKDANTTVPVRATKNYTDSDTYLEGIKINKTNLTIYKNNTTASLSDISYNDVIYYNQNTNTMDVYTKKITGIYNKAMPSKAYVTSIDVGGNTYYINKDVSTKMLDASTGSFAIGEKITLLLGENDEVCFAVELSDFSNLDYGIVLKTYTAISSDDEDKGASKIMASILMGDGNTYEYETNKNYSSFVGNLVNLKFEDGVVSMTEPESSNTYGELDISKRTLNSKTVLKDVLVFNRLTAEDSAVCQAQVLNFDTLGVNNISKTQLITSVSANKFGDISVLYLCDMPSSYNYGIIRDISDPVGESSKTTYKIYHNANTTEYVSESRYQTKGLAPVYFTLSGSKISKIGNLSTIASANSISAVESGRIMINDKIYKMSDDVLIVDMTDSYTLKTLSVSDIVNKNVSYVALYSEKTASDDCVIRVVTVRFND